MRLICKVWLTFPVNIREFYAITFALLFENSLSNFHNMRGDLLLLDLQLLIPISTVKK